MSVIDVVAKRSPKHDESSSPPDTINLTHPIAKQRRSGAIRVPRLLRRVIGPLLVVALWQWSCSAGVFTSFEVASPLAVFDAGRELWSEGVLQSNLLVSLRRVLEGLGAGVGIGVVLAVISGLFRIGEALVDPVVQAARAVPIL